MRARWRKVLRTGTSALVDLAWPVSCAGCGRWDDAMCAACLSACEPARVTSRPVWLRELTVHSSTVYAGPVARCLTAFKDENRRDLEAMLARLLRFAVAEAIRATDAPPLLWHYVLVPSAPASLRARGRFPLGELASHLEGPGLSAGPRLVLTRKVVEQSGLSRGERRRNLAGAHALARSPGGRHAEDQLMRGARVGIVLVDDVVTTGATLAAACLAVAPWQPGAVVAATIAATGGRRTEQVSTGSPPGRPGPRPEARIG